MSHQGRAYSREEIERLLRDALTRLMGDGTAFRDLSVEKLRTEAGISRSSFYVYFADKTDLLRALEAGSLGRLYASQRLWIEKGADATRDDVLAGMRTLLDAFLEDEVVMRATAEASTYDAAVRDAYISGVGGYAGAMERLIRGLQGEGRRTHLDPPGTSLALAWMTERTVFLHAAGASPAQRDAIAAGLADVVWATLFSC